MPHLANWLLHSGHWQVYGFSPEQDFTVSIRNTGASTRTRKLSNFAPDLIRTTLCHQFQPNSTPHCHNISQVQSYQALLEIFPMPIFTACLNLKSTSRTVFPSSIKCEVIIILPNNFDFIHHHCMSNILVILSKYHITKFFAVIRFLVPYYKNMTTSFRIVAHLSATCPCTVFRCLGS